MAQLSGGFSSAVSEWKRKAEAALLDTFKAAFIEIGTRVIDRTPLDQGEAQGSWTSSINGAGGPVATRDGDVAKAELRAIAARLTLGDTANFSSTLRYIRQLEYGHSQQAPFGMLRLTAQQWQQIAKEATALAKAKHGLN